MSIAATLLAALLILALGLWLAWCVFSALRSGIAYAAGGRKYPKKKRPVMYWLAVSAQSFFSLMCIYLVIGCFERLSR